MQPTPSRTGIETPASGALPRRAMLATLGVGAAALIGVERAVAQTTTAAARGDLTPKQLG